MSGPWWASFVLGLKSTDWEWAESDVLLLTGAGGLLHGFYSRLERLFRDVVVDPGRVEPSLDKLPDLWTRIRAELLVLVSTLRMIAARVVGSGQSR